MTLKIISAVEIVYEGEVQSVTLPGTKGNFTVLQNHASLISTLSPGKIVYRPTDSSEPVSVQVRGGLADVDNNILSVCMY